MSDGGAVEYRALLRPLVADEAAVERLVRYAVLLERWSRRHSLIRFKERSELVQRHLAEALEALPWLGETGALVDVGSGAGVPGVPLLAARPGWTGVLLEPRQKRWAFLRAVIRELGLSAEALATRFEDHQPEVEVDLVTVRGLAEVDAVLDWARSRLSAGGRVLVWGTDERESRLAARAGWRVLSCALAHLERGRLIECRPCFT